jgi:hypothetical protein
MVTPSVLYSPLFLFTSIYVAFGGLSEFMCFILLQFVQFVEVLIFSGYFLQPCDTHVSILNFLKLQI